MTRAQAIRFARSEALAGLRALVRAEGGSPAELAIAISNVGVRARALVAAEALTSNPPPPPPDFGGPCADSFCASSCTSKMCWPDRLFAKKQGAR